MSQSKEMLYSEYMDAVKATALAQKALDDAKTTAQPYKDIMDKNELKSKEMYDDLKFYHFKGDAVNEILKAQHDFIEEGANASGEYYHIVDPYIIELSAARLRLYDAHKAYYA